MTANWAASGMTMLPGLAPRPQHHIVDKNDYSEEINSTSNSLFVYLRSCENTKVNIKGKVGKVTLEHVNGVEICVNDIVVSGTLEIIKSQKVNIRLLGDAEIPTIQVDDSSDVTIEVEKKMQIERLIFIRCEKLQLLLNGQTVGDQTDATLKYDIPTSEERAEIQQIAHWSSASPEEAQFVTETLVRDGIYPTTAEMKKAAKEREEVALNKMAGMLVGGLTISKPNEDDKKSAAIEPFPGKPPHVTYGRDSEDKKKEHFDDQKLLSEKLDRLAEMIKESEHTIFFTGAGISTSAGIPDFRSGMNTVLTTGPGAWELRDNNKVRDKKHKTVSVLQAIPTATHMIIVGLLKEFETVQYVVSQNTDGLHLRSGVPSKCLSELHGNTNLEKCSKCKKKYLRDFRTRNAKKVHDHRTGRFCADSECGGELKDSIINFGESLPEKDLEKAYEHARKADLCICLGSSLTVSPANEIPEIVADRKKNLVIINLQKTPLHRKCSLPIHALCDDVMKGVAERLGVTVDKWYLQRRLRVSVEKSNQGDLTVQLIGLDLTRDLPYSLFTKVVFTLTPSSSPRTKEEITVTKQPMKARYRVFKNKDEVSCKAFFNGHYSEVPLDLNLDFTFKESSNKVEYDLQLTYDVENQKWSEPIKI